MKKLRHSYAVYQKRNAANSAPDALTLFVFDSAEERTRWLRRWSSGGHYVHTVSADVGRRLARAFPVIYHGAIYAYHNPTKNWNLVKVL